MKTTLTVVTDDIDGSDGAETISFGYQGVEYTIDLTEKNAAKLEKALTPYLAAAHRVGGRRKSATNIRDVASNRNGNADGSRGSGRTGTRRDLSAVRAWARENGYDVADRGRLHTDVLAAYDAG